MKKIRVGIIGYGYLGKAVEKHICADSRFKPIVIFSRRNIKANQMNVESIDNIEKYIGKIDIMFICTGSLNDVKQTTFKCLKYFNTIDAFDTHKKINNYINACDLIAKENKKVAFCSFGWDPGIFSIMRVLFKSIKGEAYTTWGKGISQGHSEAIRTIKYVKDAVQYTIPNKNIVKLIKGGEKVKISNLHKRLCYVVCERNKEQFIKDKILNMPNYFKGQNTYVHFVDNSNIKKYKKLYHKGEVFTQGNIMSFKIKTNSNSELTAKIMIAYSYILNGLYKENRFGAYSILDIPIGNLLNNANKFI